mmetsp:Transcript_93317/g.200260  ORF Transcript_93317/g.200260 Transcript_93317/m.200260 type:complete len:306 (+) Transcript_93317:99-1016(+)
MKALRPTLAFLLVFAAAGASTGGNGAYLQVRQARTMEPATPEAEQPPQQLAAGASTAAQPAAVVAYAHQVEVGVKEKLHRVAAWLGSFPLVHGVHHGVALALRRGRSMVGGKGATQQPMTIDPNEAEAEDLLTTLISTMISLSFWALLVGGVGFLYKQYYITPPVDIEKATASFKDQNFVHGPFSCFDDLEILAWSCCCGGIRWADTMQSIGVVTFWVGIALFMFTVILDTFTGGILMWIVIAVIFTYYRQELRKKFSMKNEGEDQFKDFCMWCCCGVCAIAQEARHVKDLPKLKQEEQAVAFQA